MLQVLCSELVNDSTNACAQLEDALRMSRQMLFELDSLIMKHVLSARKRVILSAWAHKEVPVAVLLAAESLKMELERHKQDANCEWWWFVYCRLCRELYVHLLVLWCCMISGRR